MCTFYKSSKTIFQILRSAGIRNYQASSMTMLTLMLIYGFFRIWKWPGYVTNILQIKIRMFSPWHNSKLSYLAAEHLRYVMLNSGGMTSGYQKSTDKPVQLPAQFMPELNPPYSLLTYEKKTNQGTGRNKKDVGPVAMSRHLITRSLMNEHGLLPVQDLNVVKLLH